MGQPAEGTAGRAPDGAFPALVLLLTVLLAAVAVAGGVLAEHRFGTLAVPSWPTALLFLALLTAAGFSIVRFQYRDQGDGEDLFEAVLTPAMFVLLPLQVVAVVGVALAVSEGLQRIHPVKACFNVAQWMAAAAAGSVVLAALRDGDGAGPTSSRDLFALVVAMW
ncbi:MAG TPA: hypothetical protein VFL71_12135 [Actinomycetes bacterium]|nr:hypothetical protein [Actinomycetes bacterium]